MLCFDRRHSRLSLSDVARLTGYTPAAVRRFLKTLQALDYLHSDGKHFWVKPRTLLLARPYLTSRSAPQMAQPILDKLADRTRQSATVGVLLDQEVLIVARSNGQRTLSTGLGIGSRLPVFCSALGRALLSQLSDEEVQDRLATEPMEKWTPKTIDNPEGALAMVLQSRNQGWGECDEELELGVRSVAVPITNLSDRTIAALSLSVRAERMSMEEFLAEHLAAIEEARDELIRSKAVFD